MKKNVFKMSAFALMMALAACSNEEITTTQGGEEALLASEDVIEISLTNTSSRAARPMGSSAAANNVDKLVLSVYDATGATLQTGITISLMDNGVAVSKGSNGTATIDWTATAGENPYNESHDDSKTIKLTGLAPSTTYTIVAYGYNGSPCPFTVTSKDDVTSPTTVEEIFAEVTTVTTDGDGHFKNTTITLERQVAGLLAYLKNVPAKINNNDVEKVQIKANKKTTKFKFSTDNALNGLADGVSDNNVLLTFDVSSYSDGNSDGILDITGGNVYADEYTADMRPSGLKLVDGTLFGACYVLPYDQHYAANTLVIEFLNGTGAVLETLAVKSSIQVESSYYQYDIRRNNFYSIGKKLYSDNTNGNPDPEEPDPTDPDTPIDLSGKDKIEVIINDAWAVLHDMTID